MLTSKTLALIAAITLFIVLVAGSVLFLLFKSEPDVCNHTSSGPYSNPTLTPFGTSTAIFIRFNGKGSGCAYIPATDSWTKLSELTAE